MISLFYDWMSLQRIPAISDALYVKQNSRVSSLLYISVDVHGLSVGEKAKHCMQTA